MMRTMTVMMRTVITNKGEEEIDVIRAFLMSAPWENKEPIL